MNISTLIKEEVRDQLQELHKMEVGTEQYKTAVEGICKLNAQALEVEKANYESEQAEKQFERESCLKQQQIDNERNNNKTKNIISVAGIVTTAVITVWGTLNTFKFEETGTVTSSIGRGFINKLLPKK